VRKLILFAFASLLWVGGAADAATTTRLCTKEEAKQADSRLNKIASDADLQEKIIGRHAEFGLPRATGPVANERILIQDGYIMDHDDDLRTSLWVTYRLTKKDMADATGMGRVNCFRKDPRLAENAAAFPADYSEPRYDQGHLANDADLKDDLTDQLNSYVMSNMSPQECRFNRGIWLSLESLSRIWASKYGTIYITSGAIFDRNGDKVRDDDAMSRRMTSNSGKKRVAVPSHYYKIILRKDGSQFRSIAFLLKNTNTAHGIKWSDVRPDVENTLTTIEEIEDESDLKMFPDIDRSKIDQSAGGDGWSMDKNNANLEAGCS
jgi:endonuclease G